MDCGKGRGASTAPVDAREPAGRIDLTRPEAKPRRDAVPNSPKLAKGALRSTSDLARHLGLARTTVSRVLNGHSGIRPQTIAKVQRALADTGFTPNAHALHLKGKRAMTIGICAENLLTPPALQKLAELQRVLRDRGFSSLIQVLEPGTGRAVVGHFLSLRVEAVVFLGHFLEDELAARLTDLRTHGIPHVVIDHFGLEQANTVALDRAAGMQGVVRQLLADGHRSFGLLGVEQPPRSRVDRITGIRAALREHDLAYEEVTVSLDHRRERRGDFRYGWELAESFLQQPVLPTALLALNDEIAAGALRGLRARGVRVPREVSVTGFNNQDLCEMTDPSLTSVDQNVGGTVLAATELLFEQLSGPDHSGRARVCTIEPRVIFRDSSAAAPAGRSPAARPARPGASR